MRLLRRKSREPLWKEEFSVFAAEERYVSRRQFAKFLVLASLSMFVGNLWILVRSWFRRSSSHPERIVGRLEAVPVGGVQLFSYPTEQDRCILVRIANDRAVAYSQKCTHLSCAVYYSAEDQKLVCPCHHGYFSVQDGSVLQGPPPRPLPRIVLENRLGALVAVGVEERAKANAGA
jgi:nitrite reductase/ring-hydroxylating ferredoxin subunit